MRLIFAGTPEFAATVLAALLAPPHTVVAVVTRPDRPSGRGLGRTQSAVKQLAAEHGIPVEQPASLRGPDPQQVLAAYHADVMVVAAFGLLLPETVLETPRLGCVNVHASLLPRWRGAAPIQHAILAGDPETGVSIMQMDAGLDTGPVLCRAACPIREDDTGGSLHDTLAELGAVTLVEALAALADGRAHADPQDEAMATYAGRIAKTDGLIDWSRPAHILARQVRAFNPWPVAYTWVPAASQRGDDAGQRLRIWSARAVECGSQAPPGTVLASGASGIEVAAGRDALRILTLQAAGRRVMNSGDYLNAHALTAGTVLEGAGSART